MRHALVIPWLLCPFVVILALVLAGCAKPSLKPFVSSDALEGSAFVRRSEDRVVVPVVFCGWVLIDGQRVAQMKRVAKRLKDTGRDDIRLARLISNKRAAGGVAQLVKELEAAHS